MYELKIKNFQSIKDLTLPIRGFTALVGKSNRGKSASLRALRTVLLNEWLPAFLKHGEKEAEVSFRICEQTDYLKTLFPDLDIASISVKKPANEYIITLTDGEQISYPKVGKNTPERMEALNLADIVTEREDKFNLIFQSQLESLFLITNTDIQITSFINKVFDISRFEKALRDMKSDDIKLSRDLSNIAETIREKEEYKLTLADTLHDTENKISSLESALCLVESTTKEQETVSKDLQTLSKVLQSLACLETDKLLLQARKKTAAVAETLLSALQKATEYCKDSCGYYNTVKAVSEVSKTLPVYRKSLQVPEQIIPNVEKYMALSKLLKSKDNYEKLACLPGVYSAVKNKISVCSEGILLLLSIYEFQNLQKTRVEGIKSTSENIKLFQKKILGAETLENNLFQHIEICPLCSQKIGSRGV